MGEIGVENMEVQVRLFATLREGRFRERRVRVEKNAVAGDLLGKLKIVESEASLMVNGRHVELSETLDENDIVSLFPPIGGG